MPQAFKMDEEKYPLYFMTVLVAYILILIQGLDFLQNAAALGFLGDIGFYISALVILLPAALFVPYFLGKADGKAMKLTITALILLAATYMMAFVLPVAW